MWLTPGTLIADRYRVSARLAGGGMGEVWVARDERLERDVAVKVIRPELSENAEFLARFRIEARAAAGLAHPGVVAVHDYGDGREGAFLIMELVQGESLAARLVRDGPLAYEAVLDLIAQAGEALQAAHDAGVIHRDIKPGNLMLRADGRIQVTDFGTARALGATPITLPGAIIGTPQYLAPEHANGGEATPANDVFALGVVAYEALTGRRPFEGPTVAATVAAVLHADPPPLPESVPWAVARLVLSCLERDPADRITPARALAARARALMPPDTPTTLFAPPVVEPRPASGTPISVGADAPTPTSPHAPTPSTPDADADAPPHARADPLPAYAAPTDSSHAKAPSPVPAGRRPRPWLVARSALPIVALAIVGGIVLNRDDRDPSNSAAPAQTPSATVSATPTPTRTATTTPTTTPTATSSSGLSVDDLIGLTPAAASAKLRDAGYEIAVSFSTSARGNPRPGTVHAIDPDPLPKRGSPVRVIAQPSG